MKAVSCLANLAIFSLRSVLFFLVFAFWPQITPDFLLAGPSDLVCDVISYDHAINFGISFLLTHTSFGAKIALLNNVLLMCDYSDFWIDLYFYCLLAPATTFRARPLILLLIILSSRGIYSVLNYYVIGSRQRTCLEIYNA